MAAARPSRLAPEQRRAQLIDIGRVMLGTRTFEELSVEEIALEAGVSRGLLFHYFGSKQEFAVAVAEASAAELLARTEPPRELEARQRALHTVTAFLDYVLANQDGYISLVRGAAAGDAALRAVSERTRDRLAERVFDQVHDLGLEVTAARRLLAYGWLALGEELVVRWLREPTIPRSELTRILGASLFAVIGGELSSEPDGASIGTGLERFLDTGAESDGTVLT